MQPAEASAGTWSRVVRLIEAHPDVKQVRLNINDHSVTVGFYETPSEETLNQIKTDVRAELSGEWDVSIKADDKSPTVHLHKIDNYTTEFHRAHPPDEPPVIWKSNSVAGVAKPSVSTTGRRAITASCCCWRRLVD